MKNTFDVITRPLFTEKGTMLKESQNKVLVEVHTDANKIEIKKAIEELFSVKVKSVTTVNVHGKKKRMGRFEGKRPDRKKALVTLMPGEKLDFIEG